MQPSLEILVINNDTTNTTNGIQSLASKLTDPPHKTQQQQQNGRAIINRGQLLR